MTDADYWKAAVLYLADCQVATSHHVASLKSTSKSERRRHASICRRAKLILAGEWPDAWQHQFTKQDAVSRRLDSAAEACLEGLGDE